MIFFNTIFVLRAVIIGKKVKKILLRSWLEFFFVKYCWQWDFFILHHCECTSIFNILFKSICIQFQFISCNIYIERFWKNSQISGFDQGITNTIEPTYLQGVYGGYSDKNFKNIKKGNYCKYWIVKRMF